MATPIQSFILISLNLACIRDLKSKAGLVDILKTYTPDVCLLQEVNIGTVDMNTIVNKYGYSSECNIDVTNENSRGTAFVWRDGLPISDINIIEPCRLQSATLGGFSLLNIYAPSGRNNRYERRELYDGPVMRAVRSLTVRDVPPILAGDHNCIDHNRDATNNQQQKMCLAFKDLQRGFGYQDTFRQLYPNKVEYTFHRANTASRLDRIYVGQLFIPFIRNVFHFPVSFSDHCGVHVELEIPNFEKPVPPPRHRSPYWKLNNSILSDSDFMSNFNDVWEIASVTKGDHPNVLSWWELDAKPQFRTFCQKYSVTLSRERRDTKQFLHFCLTKYLNEGNFEKALKIKQIN